ncbi:MAG: polyprenyl synthetase family protein [Ruminococcaceae bacterium]|nr:polyprenyl synthetase family protein [Oscillospiraceae bacterium]
MKNVLSDRIKANADLVEEALHRYLETASRPYEVLLDAMRYSAYAGGKRIRPFLTLEVCRMLGGKDETAIPYACAIEMIHTYSLIHDDLPCMDNDDVRRGKPTNHKVFGEANALLAGDALLTYAFGVAAGNRDATAEQNTLAVSLLAEYAGFDGMIGGQVLDLAGEGRALSQDDFLLMNRLKTGCLIKTACLLGALAAGFRPTDRPWQDVEQYAERIGLAFQIEDDLLDMGTEDTKTTFLTFLSPDEARLEIARLTEEAIARLSPYEQNAVLSAFAEHLASRTV